MLKGALPEEVAWACAGSPGKHEKGGFRGGKEPPGWWAGGMVGGSGPHATGRLSQSEPVCRVRGLQSHSTSTKEAKSLKGSAQVQMIREENGKMRGEARSFRRPVKL